MISTVVTTFCEIYILDRLLVTLFFICAGLFRWKMAIVVHHPLAHDCSRLLLRLRLVRLDPIKCPLLFLFTRVGPFCQKTHTSSHHITSLDSPETDWLLQALTYIQFLLKCGQKRFSSRGCNIVLHRYRRPKPPSFISSFLPSYFSLFFLSATDDCCKMRGIPSPAVR